MANSMRRNSISTLSSMTPYCRRCQLEIEADPLSDGRTRIICPFCGDFLLRGSITNFQFIKQEFEKKREEQMALAQRTSLRSRFSRTFNRFVLRRDGSANNNGMSESRQRHKNDGDVIMPAIVNKPKSDKENQALPQVTSVTTVVQIPSIKIYTENDFKSLIDDTNLGEDEIRTFFSIFYSNFDYLLKTLTQDNHNQQINWSYLKIIHQYVKDNSDNLSRLVLKTIASCCIREARPGDSTRYGYAILFLAPVFDHPSNNHIFAHILRRLTHMLEEEQNQLVKIFQTFPIDLFRSSVERLQKFVSSNIFPSRSENGNASLINGWWIPCAIRTLALFNRANEASKHRQIPLEKMSIEALNSVDIERDYIDWTHRTLSRVTSGFNFCQYPFVLSLAVKRTILRRDAEQQMVFNARRTMIQNFQNRQAPNLNMLFLNIYIRRAHLVSDSLVEVTKKRDDLKKKLRVTFVGENGLDMGGLTKEWFLLLLRQIFLVDYGMFNYYESSALFWFNGASKENLREFNLIGVLMGLAVYNSIILDVRFPLVCYKKLLTPAFIGDQHLDLLRRPKIGIIEPTLENFRTIRPEIAANLQYLLDYEGNVEDDFSLTFEVSVGQFDTSTVYPLKENGANINVTKDNRQEYVELLVDFYLNKHVAKQFEAFYYGFHSVCSSNALLLLLPEELEMLICGMQQCNLSSLAKIAKYENCHANDDLIKWFWQVVEDMSSEKQKRLLLFVTGSDRMPIGGLNEMTFKIGKYSPNKINVKDLLPMSHTCFNQLLLPAYPTREILKEKLLLAIENCEGFGIE